MNTPPATQLSPPTEIEFITGPVDAGWSKFTVRLGQQQWTCQASYLGTHPLRELVFAVLDIYDCDFADPGAPAFELCWDIWARDEPGGVFIRVGIRANQRVNVRIYRNLIEDKYLPRLDVADPAIIPVAESVVDYWQFAEAVFDDAARSLARHGITGFRNGWYPDRWDVDAHYEALPVEHLLYLGALVKNHAPVKGLSLAEEIAMLGDMLARYGEKHAGESVGRDGG